VLDKYPHLKETPSAHPLQRTEWNVRDSDAALIVIDQHGLSASIGTQRGHQWAHQHGKPEFIADTDDPQALTHAAAWLRAQIKRFGPDLTLSIGGPRESEAPGIYARARTLIEGLIDGV
jgi:hypothetical protein